MMPKKRCGILPFVLVMIAFSSCSARIEGVLREGGAADISLKTDLEPKTVALIRSIRGFMGDNKDAPVLDGPDISRSMAASPGIRSVSLKNNGPNGLDGSISVSNVVDFLASEDEKSRFISYTEGRGAGNSSIIITLDRDTAPFIISRLSSDAGDYLSALMAPVVLGEKSTRQEYLDLLTMVYGRPLADEIAGARIGVFLQFPRPVIKVQGGKAAGKPGQDTWAEFDIPLVDILVLETALRYEVSW